ncbi:MAG: hypothetical protein QNJ45_27560 [Ardenticatenaceae bacterium]|nr:hypothetical protein [Ardenticatenaceae bacterium]
MIPTAIKRPLGQLILFGLLVLAMISHLENAAGSAATPANLKIGGFDTTRASISSFPAGAAFDEVRAALATHYPQVTYTAVTTLTQPALADVDILILPSTYDVFVPISPLTTDEQNVLFNYVTSGGCAILMPENHDFNPANESLLDPFGMDITGLIWGWLTVSVPNPNASAVTNGPHGTVSSFAQGWPGGLTNLGPYATGYAANSLGTALAVIEPGAVGPESGPVIVYSDTTFFADADVGGGFSGNTTLFLNTVAFCQRQLIYLPLLIKY